MKRMSHIPVAALFAAGLAIASPAVAQDPKDESFQVGVASWYGQEFAGSITASGEPFRPGALTAAHPSLPLGTEVKVVNMENGREVVVRINDRGPFAGDRIIDLSEKAAKVLAMRDDGLAKVRVEPQQ